MFLLIPERSAGVSHLTNETSRLQLLDDLVQLLHGLEVLRERGLVMSDSAFGSVLDDQSPGILHPNFLLGLFEGDPFGLLHGHGDQLGDSDGGLSGA